MKSPQTMSVTKKKREGKMKLKRKNADIFQQLHNGSKAVPNDDYSKNQAVTKKSSNQAVPNDDYSKNQAVTKKIT